MRGNRTGAPPAGRTEQHDRGAVSTSAISTREPRTTSAGSNVTERASTLSVPMTPFAAGPHRVLVRTAPAGHGDRSGSVQIAHPLIRRRRRGSPDPQRLSLLTHHRVEGRIGMHPLDPVPALVAQPSVVHGPGIDAQQPHQAVRRRLARPGTARAGDTRVSAVARSQGRARKRYWLAVNAPTGQICTVLPEK